jgi:hypothetical protein
MAPLPIVMGSGLTIPYEYFIFGRIFLHPWDKRSGVACDSKDLFWGKNNFKKKNLGPHIRGKIF